MRIGSTLIFTMVVAGEDSSAMGMNSRLRPQAGGKFLCEDGDSRGAGLFGHALQIRGEALEHVVVSGVARR